MLLQHISLSLKEFFFFISTDYLIILVSNVIGTATVEALNFTASTIRSKTVFRSGDYATCGSWCVYLQDYRIEMAVFSYRLMLLHSD